MWVIEKNKMDKLISKQSKRIRKQLINGIEEIVKNPFFDNVKKINRMDNTYRKRIGEFRIVYEVNKESNLLRILKIDNRKEKSLYK